MNEGFYSVDGLRLRYLEWGETPSDPIVLIHGFSSTADAWVRVGEVLGADYHVIAPDLRGHGESDWDSRSATRTTNSPWTSTPWYSTWASPHSR